MWCVVLLIWYVSLCCWVRMWYVLWLQLTHCSYSETCMHWLPIHLLVVNFRIEPVQIKHESLNFYQLQKIHKSALQVHDWLTMEKVMILFVCVVVVGVMVVLWWWYCCCYDDDDAVVVVLYCSVFVALLCICCIVSVVMDCKCVDDDVVVVVGVMEVLLLWWWYCCCYDDAVVVLYCSVFALFSVVWTAGAWVW